jgi:hypothetical protein
MRLRRVLATAGLVALKLQTVRPFTLLVFVRKESAGLCIMSTQLRISQRL